jgi:hypothetical protein
VGQKLKKNAHYIFYLHIFISLKKGGGGAVHYTHHRIRQEINVEPYLEEADENSYLFFLNDISSQF